MKRNIIIFILAVVAVAAISTKNVEANNYIFHKADTIKSDLVCGMKVKSPFLHKSLIKEKEYVFCSKSCKNKFDQKPEKYIKK